MSIDQTGEGIVKMKRIFQLMFVLEIVLGGMSAGTMNKKPVKVAAPLSADEVAIYKAVLRAYSDKKDIVLNVSQTTYPLDPDFPMEGLREECVKDIHLENLMVVSRSFHQLTPDVLPGKPMKLVDPGKQAKIVHSNDPSKTIDKGKPVKDAVETAFSTGLFSMSEIAFDKERQFAVVSYRFWCGSLCGQGTTIVFKKIKGEWRNSNRNCGGWIS
ncbi:MAG TPA: hypothetical protein VFR08_10055 [Candidatus Angelobacter sp.]|nr:hypothetical protein [Candidatus Angelobacter sp.]